MTLDEEYKFNCTEELIFIDTQFFPKLIHYLRKGDRIYLDEGQVRLAVRDIGFDCINCIVEEGGKRITTFVHLQVCLEALSASHFHEID